MTIKIVKTDNHLEWEDLDKNIGFVLDANLSNEIFSKNKLDKGIRVHDRLNSVFMPYAAAHVLADWIKANVPKE